MFSPEQLCLIMCNRDAVAGSAPPHNREDLARMAGERTEPQSDWLEMSDAAFEEIRGKADLILRTIPTLLDKAEADSRAMLALGDNRAIESLSRKRLAEQLLECAQGRLEQATTTRGLLAMLDSTWRCLAEIRRAYRASVPDAGLPPQEGTGDGG